MPFPAPLQRLLDRIDAGQPGTQAILQLGDEVPFCFGVSALIGPFLLSWGHEVAPGIQVLRTLEALDLTLAPRVERVFEASDGVSFVLARYAGCDGEVVPAGSWTGPCPDTVKRRTVAELERLVEAGWWHPYARQSFKHWVVCTTTGQLALRDWGAIHRTTPERAEGPLADARFLLYERPYVLGTHEGALHLTSRLAAWLRDARAPDDLAEALVAAGCGVEADLWRAFQQGRPSIEVPDGRWAGCTAWLGPLPPASPERGDLWLDPVEIVVCLFIGDGWLALHPLRAWQLDAWPELPVDRDAIERPDDARNAVVNLTAMEAEAVAHALGKTLPTPEQWSTVPGVLSDRDWIEGDLWRFAQDEWLAGDGDTRPVHAIDFIEHDVPTSRRPGTGVRTFLPVGRPAEDTALGPRARFERA